MTYWGEHVNGEDCPCHPERITKLSRRPAGEIRKRVTLEHHAPKIILEDAPITEGEYVEIMEQSGWFLKRDGGYTTDQDEARKSWELW